MKDILGTYYIADCEHRGDIERAKSYINSIGGKVLSSHWDGYDCGEAYLEISLPIDVFKKVYKNCSFQMDADINDYIKSENIDDKTLPKKEFDTLFREMKSGKVNDGFEKTMPLYLFFSAKGGNKSVNPSKVINDVVEILGDETNVVATNTRIVDGTTFYSALITTNVDNLTKEKMQDKIGDFSLGNSRSSYMSINNLYGDCTCIHPIIEHARDYEVARWAVKRVIEKGTLIFTNYYKDKEITYNEYVEDGMFRARIDGNFQPSLLKSFQRRNMY